MALVLQLTVNGLLAAALYALVAAGLSFLYATTKIFHLAHGVVVLAAGYVFWATTVALGWPTVAGVLAAVAAATALGLLANELVYETLRRRGTRGLGYLVATLALLMLGTGLTLAVFGAAPKTFRLQTASLTFAGVYVTTLQLGLLATSVALLTAFAWVVHRTKFGRAMRAVADNEVVAAVLGVDAVRVRRTAFACSSLLAAAAGIFVGLEFNLDPNMGTLLAVRGFAAVVIGGVGSFGGVVLGSLLVGFAEQAAVWFLGAGWRNAVTFLLLFVFLLIRPEGFLGRGRDR